MTSVLEGIVERRRARVRAEGRELGAPVPAARRSPLVPFGSDPFLICEFKRRSPSRGVIAEGAGAAERARGYAALGVKNISVLTEEDHFSGSLEDLMEVKAAVPGAAVLRKDFLLDAGDVEVSYRAGADAVLLIAALLTAGEMAGMHRCARELGMEALVEVHSEEEVNKARGFRPTLTGINCRDLRDFSTDLLLPLRLARLVDWPTRLVFESGVHGEEDALLALSSGFAGILAGESVMREPGTAADILKAYGRSTGRFWRKLVERSRPGRPLVKVCGITREEDARLADDLGADILGFILAPSPRRADPLLLERLGGTRAARAAVVVDAEGAARAARLAAEGLIDVVQFHGDEAPRECFTAAFPYYKALRLRDAADIPAIGAYRCPRVLVDGFSGEARGGTGRAIPAELVEAARKVRPLWLAGGIGPENVREIRERFSPELIDASSRLESSPGVKDPGRLRAFFKETDRD